MIRKTFVSHKNGAYLPHPVKDPPPGHVEDLGSSVLAVLLGKQGHLQLKGKVHKKNLQLEGKVRRGSQGKGWHLEGRRVSQVLRFLLHVLVLHALHI